MPNNNPTKIRCGAIIIKDNKILLIKRVKPDRTYWVFPGGGIEQGETVEEGLEREVYEETGLVITSYEKCFSFCDFKMGIEEIYFLVEARGREPQILGIEKERQAEDNKYELCWEHISILDALLVFPPPVRVWLQEYLKTQCGKPPANLP